MPLHVLVLTMPAHGHYMTIRDIAVVSRARHGRCGPRQCAEERAECTGFERLPPGPGSFPPPPHPATTAYTPYLQALARRGHDVTFALCDQSRGSFDADGLGAVHGVRWLSAGGCPTYARREDALRELIARPGDLGAMGRMLDGVAQLGLEMCESARGGGAPHASTKYDPTCTMHIRTPNNAHATPTKSRTLLGTRP
jgi:hypothetical protein